MKLRNGIAVLGLCALALSLSVGSSIAKPGKSKGNTEAASTTNGASKACKAERKAIGVDAFNAKYGKNKSKKNALGKCISAHTVADDEDDVVEDDTEQVQNAAQSCQEEQADPNFAASHGGETFDEFYGTNPNANNAFGKCVSTKAQAQSPNA